MDLRWQPEVHSRSRVDISYVTVNYEAVALERYQAAYEPWLKSERKNYSVWGEYAKLAKSGRFLLPFPGESPSRRFAELHTALSLQREGFTCWGGVLLFAGVKEVRKGKGRALANTEEVRAKWPWPRWPSDIQGTLGFQPRNPDIVAYSEDRNEWRFCEAKRKDSIASGQLGALAVLHLLTGAAVAVVRVVEAGKPKELQPLPAEITYRDGAKLDWIARGF